MCWPWIAADKILVVGLELVKVQVYSSCLQFWFQVVWAILARRAKLPLCPRCLSHFLVKLPILCISIQYCHLIVGTGNWRHGLPIRFALKLLILTWAVAHNNNLALLINHVHLHDWSLSSHGSCGTNSSTWLLFILCQGLVCHICWSNALIILRSTQVNCSSALRCWPLCIS